MGAKRGERRSRMKSGHTRRLGSIISKSTFNVLPVLATFHYKRPTDVASGTLQIVIGPSRGALVIIIVSKPVVDFVYSARTAFNTIATTITTTTADAQTSTTTTAIDTLSFSVCASDCVHCTPCE